MRSKDGEESEGGGRKKEDMRERKFHSCERLQKDGMWMQSCAQRAAGMGGQVGKQIPGVY